MFARVLREAFAPPVIVLAMLAIMVATSARSVVDAVRLGLVPLLFAVVIPLAFVVLQVRRGKLTDHHISLRSQRRVPLLLAGLGVFVTLVYLVLIGASRNLIAAVLAGLAGLLVTLAITQVWKVSLHVATLAGAVTVLALAFGLRLLPLAILVPLVAWSRVRLGDHTAAQVSVGAVVGAVVSAAVFTLTR